jgi:hypothetical protein
MVARLALSSPGLLVSEISCVELSFSFFPSLPLHAGYSLLASYQYTQLEPLQFNLARYFRAPITFASW